MSERLKRRKKPADGSTPAKDSVKAPEPLQPRFYDDEPSATPARPVEVPVAESRRAPTPEPEPVLTATTPATEPGTRPTRRRRSRGGRGRSRQRPAATAPVSVEEPLPAEASATERAASESSRLEPALIGEAPAEITPPQTWPVTDVPPQAVPTHAVASHTSPGKSPGTRTPGAAAAPARASKGTVVLAIGLPGSGKSSWFKRHNIHPLSSDLLRELLFDDAQEQRFQDLVFSNLRSMLKARLIARRPMNYVDATNLTPHDRHSWIKLAKDYGYDVQGVYFDVPLEVCMERHQRRGRAVPEDIMRKMAGKLKAPTFDEGFSKITVVRVKQKERAAE